MIRCGGVHLTAREGRTGTNDKRRSSKATSRQARRNQVKAIQGRGRADQGSGEESKRECPRVHTYSRSRENEQREVRLIPREKRGREAEKAPLLFLRSMRLCCYDQMGDIYQGYRKQKNAVHAKYELVTGIKSKDCKPEKGNKKQCFSYERIESPILKKSLVMCFYIPKDNSLKITVILSSYKRNNSIDCSMMQRAKKSETIGSNDKLKTS